MYNLYVYEKKIKEKEEKKKRETKLKKIKKNQSGKINIINNYRNKYKIIRKI